MEDTYSIARHRPRRTIRKPARYAIDDKNGLIAYALAVAKETLEGVEPSTYWEAISCPNSSNWLMEMEEDMKRLHKNGTWELCELPKGHRIYKHKKGIPEVEDASWKAHLVVRGCNQKEDSDLNEVFSPVVRHTSIRVQLVLVVLFDLELEQLDVKIAFLHSELEEEIYM